MQILVYRAVDPNSFFADPDPAIFLNADPDPGCKMNADPSRLTNLVFKKTHEEFSIFVKYIKDYFVK